MSTSRALVVLSLAGVLAACSAGDHLAPPQPERPGLLAALAPGNGTPGIEEVEVCKRGSSGTFSYSVDRLSNGVGTDETGSFNLADGECMRISQAEAPGIVVSVTETGSQAGFVLDRVEVTRTTASSSTSCQTKTSSTTTETGPTAGGTASGGADDGECDGTFIVFYNVEEPVDMLPGRMTGGGHQITIGNVKITRGFTIHCDIVLSNNIEVNWPGNKWHLDKPITSAVCLDDPTISPVPPEAPFDTFIGEGIGRLNGVDGARIRFVFQDGGEPGRQAADRAQIQIWDVNNNLVLDVPLQYLTGGNIQAHYDQPHK